ncbi:hypothetical protein BSF38_05593 [Paludisphaera borealis]|uniref:Uncharacterized protein n=1 Tax=Paludisphaera borealis TaxID=1387353 RepID=A0A1U7CYI6_9BACT|nr:hypothetical protein BSF38_05593 [Paludisphaera borealis]
MKMGVPRSRAGGLRIRARSASECIVLRLLTRPPGRGIYSLALRACISLLDRPAAGPTSYFQSNQSCPQGRTHPDENGGLRSTGSGRGTPCGCPVRFTPTAHARRSGTHKGRPYGKPQTGIFMANPRERTQSPRTSRGPRLGERRPTAGVRNRAFGANEANPPSFPNILFNNELQLTIMDSPRRERTQSRARANAPETGVERPAGGSFQVERSQSRPGLGGCLGARFDAARGWNRRERTQSRGCHGSGRLNARRGRAARNRSRRAGRARARRAVNATPPARRPGRG